MNLPGAIKLDKYGNIYVCGTGYYQTTGNDFLTIKYSPTGEMKWFMIYSGVTTNGGDGAYDLYIDTSLNVYVTGNSKKMTNSNYDAVTIKYNQPVGILSNGTELPLSYNLFQNYPNPFNNTTLITYQLSKGSIVELLLYNSVGQLVKSLVSNLYQQSGVYNVMFNMDGYSSGIYFYKIKAVENTIIGNRIFEETKKLVFLK